MPTQQKLQLQIAGLYTFPNSLSEVPANHISLGTANDVVLDKPSVIESRRGQNFYGNQLSVGTGYINNLWVYKNTLMLNYNGTLAYDSNGSGNWSNLSGTYAPPTNYPVMRSTSANENFYLTTDNGVIKIQAPQVNPIPAGVPQGLDTTGTLTGTTGFLAPNAQCAYRIVWGYNDDNQNLNLGAPSSRIVVTNAPINVNITGTGTSGGTVLLSSTAGVGTGMELIQNQSGVLVSSVITSIPSAGTVTTSQTESWQVGSAYAGFNENVTLNFSIPQGIGTNYFYQVYRSQQTLGTIVPNDELSLAYEGNPAGTDLTNKYIQITDITTDALLGAALYTNPSQEGILQSNYEPPLCTDMTQFRGYTFYANTIQPQRLNITLIGVGSPGLGTGDTITIAGQTYTAGTATNTSTGTFAAITTGDEATDIQNAANALIQCINRNPSSSAVYAYYQSGYNELPGQILIQSRTVGAGTFQVNVSNPAAWTPTLPTSGTNGNNVSSNNQQQNYIYCSKFEIPEAVPIVNNFPVGDADFPIQRIIALRDALFIIKQDGIFRLIGQDLNSFQVYLLDNTVVLRAPEGAVTLNNQIFCMTNQGVVAISDNGVTAMSRPIESDLLQLSSDLYPNFDNVSFGVSYESDRKYIFYTVTEPSDLYPTQAFVYNYATQSWTKWTTPRTCGVVNTSLGDGILFTGQPTNDYVYKERKEFTLNDYADEQYTVTITSSSNYTINLTNTSLIQVGMTIEQSTQSAIVTAINSSTQITVNETGLAWSAGSATVYTPIINAITTNPIHCDNAGLIKHFQDLTYIFRQAAFITTNVGYTTDFNLSLNYHPLSAEALGAWGQFNWGQQPWGGSIGLQQTIRDYIDLQNARGHWIYVNVKNDQAFTALSLEGLSLTYSPISTREF